MDSRELYDFLGSKKGQYHSQEELKTISPEQLIEELTKEAIRRSNSANIALCGAVGAQVLPMLALTLSKSTLAAFFMIGGILLVLWGFKRGW